MRQEQIGELRMSLLTIMDEIHRVCEENNITYYIIGELHWEQFVIRVYSLGHRY